MPTMLFVSLPVSDIERSRMFFEAVGFRFEEALCDAGTLCLLVNDSARVLLHQERRFAGYAAQARPPGGEGMRETVVAVSAASRTEVDHRVAAASTHGGHELRAPLDLDAVYTRAVVDPDSHIWEFVYLDPAGLPGTPGHRRCGLTQP